MENGPVVIDLPIKDGDVPVRDAGVLKGKSARTEGAGAWSSGWHS